MAVRKQRTSMTVMKQMVILENSQRKNLNEGSVMHVSNQDRLKFLEILC